MSSYAYRDELRKQIIYAKNARAIDKEVNFFCENPDCHALMRLSALNSEGVSSPYFTANITDFGHIDDCYFSSLNKSFDETCYDEKLFNFEEIVNEYLSNNVKRIPRRLYTLPQIYRMCKNRDIHDSYNKINIWKILCDSRSNQIYTKGIYGPHLIECKCVKFIEKELALYFKYPFNDSLPNKHNLKVVINNRNLFFNLLNLLLTHDKKIVNRPVIIIGNWKKISNNYVSNIVTKTQIYIP